MLLSRFHKEISLLNKYYNYSNKINYMKTKMKLIASLKIWVVIYPSITVFLYLLGKSSVVLPLYVKTFFLTVTLVPWIVFIGVPFVDKFIECFQQKFVRNNQG